MPMLMAAEVMLPGWLFKRDGLVISNPCRPSFKGTEVISFQCYSHWTNTTYIYAFCCKPHCSVTQCQPVSETCVSNSDNHKFQQHECYMLASGLWKGIKLNCFPSCNFILRSGKLRKAKCGSSPVV